MKKLLVDGVGDVGVWGESTLGGIKDFKDILGNRESNHIGDNTGVSITDTNGPVASGDPRVVFGKEKEVAVVEALLLGRLAADR